MKKKYKTQVIIFCLAIAVLFGGLFGFLIVKFPTNVWVIGCILFLALILTTVIGIKSIANRIKNDPL
jgi:ABC-type uncharacterized transport system permease subunit